MDQKDRDLLIKLNTKMDQLCETANKNNKDNTEAHKDIMQKIDDNFKTTTKWVDNVHGRIDDQIKGTAGRIEKYNETFLQSKTFYWVVGFVIAGLLSAWGTITYLGKEVHQVKTKHSIYEKALEHYHPDYLDSH